MKKRTIEILNIIDDMYGTDMRCYLNHENAWQLLIATILSAQCTDARVNIVTDSLFKKYTSIKDFANASLSELENDIKPTGFYHNKAKNIIECCKKLHYEYNDEVPSSIEELTSLSGVGRKTANVIRGNISNRRALTKESDPVKIEFDLMKELPKDHWILFNIQIITFGREICSARSPKCEQCRLKKYCKYYKKGSD